MNNSFTLAAVLSLLTWGIHTFLGGPSAAKPLLESSMEPIAKYTNYYCWHLVTIVLFSMAVGYGFAAVVPSGLPLAIFLTFLSVSFTVWSLVLVVLSKRKLFELPQWMLFAVIAAVSIVGIIT